MTPVTAEQIRGAMETFHPRYDNPESPGYHLEVIEFLEVVAKARRIYRTLDTVALRRAEGKEGERNADLLLSLSLEADAAIGRVLQKPQWERRERGLERLRKSDEWQVLCASIYLLEKYAGKEETDA